MAGEVHGWGESRSALPGLWVAPHDPDPHLRLQSCCDQLLDLAVVYIKGAGQVECTALKRWSLPCLGLTDWDCMMPMTTYSTSR